jgi:hypothetical protein
VDSVGLGHGPVARCCERGDEPSGSGVIYGGRKITASFGNVTVRGEKRWKAQGGSATAKSLSEHV